MNEDLSDSILHFLTPETQRERLRAARKIALPSNYNFEIAKSLRRIKVENAKRVALQFPEGLMIFALAIADIIEEFSSSVEDVVILGDVTYGGCCIDDYTSLSVQADFLIHYGHSCLVPIDSTTLPCLYVFVEIGVPVNHFCDTIKSCFPIKKTIEEGSPQDETSETSNVCAETSSVCAETSSVCAETSSVCAETSNVCAETSNVCAETCGEGLKESDVSVDDVCLFESKASKNEGLSSYWWENPRIALMGTVQYGVAIHRAKVILEEYYGKGNVCIPQESPLSSGEVLGCTSPSVITRSCSRENGFDFGVFLSDGRFHVESALMKNPRLPIYRYDPFLKRLTRERCKFEKLHQLRSDAIERARKAIKVCLILSTLGRQGSVGILETLQKRLEKQGVSYFVILISELNLPRLELIGSKNDKLAFIQIGCPRLSVDWGHLLQNHPLLNPYEAFVAFGEDVHYLPIYPMDYFSNQGDIWSNYNSLHKHRDGSLGKIYTPEQRKQQMLEKWHQIKKNRQQP